MPMEAILSVASHVKNPESSPLRKRSRMDPTVAEKTSALEKVKMNKRKSDIILDSMAEIGIARLESDSEDEATDKYPNFLNLSLPSNNKARIEKEKEIAMVLQSTLSKETLQKISLGQWNNLAIERPSRESVFKINYFQQLSDEVILQIFHWLPKSNLANAALVCRRWHRLVQDESLWTRMDVSSRSLGPGALGYIISRQVIILRLANSDISDPAILPCVKASLPDFRARLLYLDLSMAHISCTGLIALFSKCQRLKKLSLEHLTVDNDVFLALSRNRELEVLNLAMVEGIALDGLKYLLSSCHKLKELNIGWTYLTKACVAYVCSNLPSTLDRLNLSGCRKLIHDGDVHNLVKQCPHLRELDLSDCTGLAGGAIRHIVLLEELNFLALSRCYFIPYHSLLKLKVIKSLMYLEIHGAYLDMTELDAIETTLGTNVNVNKFKFSSVARPTVGPRRSSIWGLRVRE